MSSGTACNNTDGAVGGGGADGEGDTSSIQPQTTKPPPTKLIPSGVVCLRGNLVQETRDNIAVHRITGLWSMGLDKILADPENKLGLCSDFEYEHKMESSSGESSAAAAAAFPPSGTYSGSFMINNAGVMTKVEEQDVVLNFVENSEGYYNVKGKGSNSFGKYTISGTLTKEKVITIYRHYPLLVVQPTKVKKKESVPQAKPPPTKLIPTGVVCLRGKLVRKTSEGISLDKYCVHKITGLWSMGLDKIIADPENTKGECNNFEYEHKASGGVTAFPLSGKYTGSFFVDAPQGGAKTKIEEKNVMLKFRENNEGYHNVEGKGSNVWGKYSITGTLNKDGEITLFRHYQAAKAHPQKKVAAAKQHKAPAKTKQTRPGSNNNAASKVQTPNKSFTPSRNPNTAAGEYLLERLRILLNRLQASTEILQNWPEAQGDSAKIHADTATELIASIRKIVTGVRAVERHVNGTGPSPAANIPAEALEKFRLSLDEKCPIPLDLLDLLDIGQPFGINPLCYARGLMKEAMRQLAGLERRKNALAMLGKAIEKGLNARSNNVDTEPTDYETATTKVVTVNKRKRDEGDETDVVVETSKKMRTD
ncbi:hypothetical protein ACHAXM_008437 [Skeletonema potamos]